MKVSFSTSISASPDILICPVFENNSSFSGYDTKLKIILNDLKKKKLFSGKNGEMELVYNDKKNMPDRIAFVGLGKKSKISSSDLRNTMANATKKIMQLKIKKIAFYLIKALEKNVQEVGEGIMLVNYTTSKYKTGKDAEKVKENLFSEVVLVSKKMKKDVKNSLNRALKITESVKSIRDLVNGPGNIVTIENFVKEARKIAKENQYSIKVLDKTKLEKLGMGAFLSVNQGSGKRGAKMVILEYKPANIKKTSKNTVLLIGKGLIFDSGGYNLKPSKHIEDMQQDKAGGSVVLGVFKLLKALNIKKHVVGIVPLAENLIDADAQKPADIVTSYSKKTIEIRNTDAEGRMLLADTLAYGIKKYKPAYTVDLATLTGACIIALGNRYAGVITNEKKLFEALKKAGDETDELVWQLPLHKDFSEDMKGKMADLRNIDDGTSHLAGASKAAAFLQYFVRKTKWAHIDIAGTAYNMKPKPIDQPMATGFGVRLITKFIEDL